MRAFFVFLMISLLGLSGCKEDVGFSQAPSQGFGSVEPIVEELNPTGPTVRIVQGPADHWIDGETQAVFEVVPGDFPVSHVQCMVNNIEVSCARDQGFVSLVNYPVGTHQLMVVAIDEYGLSGSSEEDWEVFDKFRGVNENHVIDFDKAETDILFVVDNSASMKFEQTKISQRFGQFIRQIRNLDWHLAITTTDIDRNQGWGDGKLSAFANGETHLTPAVGEKQAQVLFGQNIQRRENGSNVEQGIYTTFRAIERSANPQSDPDRALASFFRDDSALAVVVVSDEDESGSTIRNRGSELIKHVERTWGKDKVFQFNSIIVHTQECLNGEGYAMGYKYEDLSQQTGGSVGDICAKNYSKLLRNLGKGVANLQKIYKLECDPQDIDEDGQIDLTVVGDNVPGYTIEGDKIVFENPLDKGSYKFHYFCPNN